MINLTNEELKKVDGGGFNLAAASGIAALIAFFVGVYDGVVRPLKCR